jgi:hypothetical protein
VRVSNRRDKYPVDVGDACATSARIFPLLRSTNSSSFGKKAPITGRRRGAPAGAARPPALRARRHRPAPLALSDIPLPASAHHLR